MALPVNYPLGVDEFSSYTGSLGATPLAAYVHIANAGYLIEIGVVQSAAVTGTSTVTVTNSNGGATIGTITVTGGGAGSVFTFVPTISTTVSEDDVLIFTPAGGTGASIYGTCFAKVRGS